MKPLARVARLAYDDCSDAVYAGDAAMLFAAFITYTPDKEKIAAVRPTHRAYLTQLHGSGQLLAAGPFLDDSGALIIYEADSAAAATNLIEGDPFHQHGIFVRYDLKPWKAVFGNRMLLPDGTPK